jgi:import receptor subunit TOM70
MGEVSSAKQDLEESLRIKPDLTQSLVKLASVCMEQGDPQAAFDCFDKAIEFNPSDPDIYYHRGQVYFIMNEFQKAAENYTNSTELDESFVFSHIQLAVAQYKMGDIQKSMAKFRRTLTKFRDMSEPYNY